MGPFLNFVLVLFGVFSLLIGFGFLLIIPFSLVSPYINQNKAFSLSGIELVSLLFVASLLFILSFFLFRFSKTSWDKSDLKNWKFWVLVILAGFLSEPIGKLFGNSGPKVIQSLLLVGIPAFIAVRHSYNINRSGGQTIVNATNQNQPSNPIQFPSDLKDPVTSPIIIELNRKDMLVGVFASGIFTIMMISVFFFIKQSDQYYLLTILFLFITIPTFGLVTIWTLYRYLKPLPKFIISKEGIFHNVNFYSVGWIRWTEISRIFSYQLAWQYTLGIVPKDMNAILKRLNLFKRTTIRIMQIINIGAKAPISIPEIALGFPIDNLIKSMDRYVDAETKKTIQFG